MEESKKRKRKSTNGPVNKKIIKRYKFWKENK